MGEEFRTTGVASDVVTQSTVSERKWIVALLWSLLGVFGFHRFYIGRVGSGFAMLFLWLIGWLTLGFIIGGVLLVIDVVWAVIDFFRVLFNGLTDGQGRKLR